MLLPTKKYKGTIQSISPRFRSWIVKLDQPETLPFATESSDLVVVNSDCPGRLDVIRHTPVTFRKKFLWFQFDPVQNVIGQRVEVEIRPGMECFKGKRIHPLHS